MTQRIPEGTSWADEMDEADGEAGVGGGGPPAAPPGDLLSAVAVTFPAPGELWVHLCAACHYLSSVLLETYPPPWDPPFLVRGDGKPSAASPFRIDYGVHNPALRGTVITNSFIVPAFGWTPRMAMDRGAFAAALRRPCPDGLLVLPAVRGAVVRAFRHSGTWYLATGARLEAVPPPGQPLGRIGVQFDACVRTHVVQGLRRLLRDLRTDRVWFFGLFPERATLMGLGTCRLVSHHELRSDVFGAPDYGFSVHGDVAPSVPILPTLRPDQLAALGAAEEIIEPGTEEEEAAAATGEEGTEADGPPPPTPPPRYRGLFDGVLLVNPATLFAVRIGCPEAVFLAPLLRNRVSLAEFLAQAAVSAAHPEGSAPDPASRAYWAVTQPALVRRIFGDDHGELVRRVDDRVRDLYPWLAAWMRWAAGLSVDEWLSLDVGLQRLYVILEHETPVNWPRVVGAPRYHGLVAKAVAFCVQYWP